MIREPEPCDAPVVASLLERAYGQPEEAKLVETLRQANDLLTELVWEQDGAILGHVSVARHLHPEDWCIISTTAVDDTVRGRGIGTDLVRAALETARKQNAGAVTVLGNARYYQRFGFTKSAASALETPFPKDITLMYPIRIENAEIMAELVYPSAYARL